MRKTDAEYEADYQREMREIEEESDRRMAIAKEFEIDQDMLKNLTVEDMNSYDCPVLELEKLEGNYLEEFEKKVEEGSIEVSEKYRNYIENYRAPLRGIDPRTGVYGIKYTAAGFYSAGCKYMEQGKLDEALANFAKAIELWPRHVPARGYRATIYFAKGDFTRAYSEAWNAINLNPVMIAEKDESAREMSKLVNPEGTAAYASMLVEHLVISGMALLHDESYDDALTDFDECIKRNPDVLNAYHGRVAVYMKFSEWIDFKDWDKIIENCDMLIKAKYEELYAYQCRGIAYNRLDKLDEAIADFTAAISIDANLSVPYLHRGHCYYKIKEYEKAAADEGEAIRHGSTDGFYYRGIAYMELGEYQKAVADFDEALRYFDRDDEDYDEGDDGYITEKRKEALELLEKGGKS